MKNLSNYEQIDILKFLNFNQLFSAQQTNYYFNLLIEQNKWILAIKESYRISICGNTNYCVKFSRLIEPNIVNYPINDELLKKLQSVVERRIPLYLFNHLEHTEEDRFVYFSPNQKIHSKIKLPNYPKNIEEIKTIYFWLEKLFRCFFKESTFQQLIFNPEIIKLLFGNISLKFHIERFYLIFFYNHNYKYQFEFIIDHLVITKTISLYFDRMDNMEEQNNFLSKLLLNSGKRISGVCIKSVKDPSTLITSIINNIKMSEDCSEIVPKIKFRGQNGLGFKMEIKADKIKKNDNFEKIALCEYKNIYDPKIKFLAKFYYREPKDEMIFKFDIARIKEE